MSDGMDETDVAGGMHFQRRGKFWEAAWNALDGT